MQFRFAHWQYQVTPPLFGLTPLDQYPFVYLPTCRHFALLTVNVGCPWLRHPRMLAELTGELQSWGSKTGWPVSNIVKSLVESDHYA